MATKKEDIEFCEAYLTRLIQVEKDYWHLSPKDLSPSQENPDAERVARLADEYGFEGSLFRDLIPDENPLSRDVYNRHVKKIETIPKIITAIEQYKEPVTIPDDAELLSVSQVAVMLGWGESVVRQRDRDGLLPMPIRNGGTIQWYRQELKDWIKAKCPPRLKWEQLKHGKAV